MSERIEWSREDTIAGNKQWTLRVALAFGWRVEIVTTLYHRPRLVVVGGGLHLGEPWGYQGALWSLNVRVYVIGVAIGLRGPDSETPEWEDDDYDSGEFPVQPEAPNAD